MFVWTLHDIIGAIFIIAIIIFMAYCGIMIAYCKMKEKRSGKKNFKRRYNFK